MKQPVKLDIVTLEDRDTSIAFGDDDLTEFLVGDEPEDFGELGELVDGLETDVAVWLEGEAPAEGPARQKATRAPVWKQQVRHELAVEHVIMRSKAAAAVHRATQRGELPPALGQTCVGCGGKADRYDHRDYSKPLDVVPVCATCNAMRGRARLSLTPRQMRVVRLRAEARALRAEFTHAGFLKQCRDSLVIASASNMSPDPLPADHRKAPRAQKGLKRR